MSTAEYDITEGEHYTIVELREIPDELIEGLQNDLGEGVILPAVLPNTPITRRGNEIYVEADADEIEEEVDRFFEGISEENYEVYTVIENYHRVEFGEGVSSNAVDYFHRGLGEEFGSRFPRGHGVYRFGDSVVVQNEAGQEVEETLEELASVV